MKKPYKLCINKGSGSTKVIECVSMPALIKAWTKHFGTGSIRAVAIVGDQEVTINDRMPILTDVRLRDRATWDQAVIDEAEYFTAVRFLGVGKYERHERPTKKEIARHGQKLANKHGAHYMIYAVNSRGNSVYVDTVRPQNGKQPIKRM